MDVSFLEDVEIDVFNTVFYLIHVHENVCAQVNDLHFKSSLHMPRA